jgi:hypothetical protein
MPDKAVKTGTVTPEIIREAMDRVWKGEIYRPQWTVEPYLYDLIKKNINTE